MFLYQILQKKVNITYHISTVFKNSISQNHYGFVKLLYVVIAFKNREKMLIEATQLTNKERNIHTNRPTDKEIYIKKEK